MAGTGKLFISHSSQDDGIVRELQQVLGDLYQDVWIDSRELCGGNPLLSKIQHAIEEAPAYAVVISPASNESKWVEIELKYALDVQQRREHPGFWQGLFRRKPKNRRAFSIIPILLDGAKPGALGKLFSEEPIYIPISSEAGGIDAALNAILVALGKRLPSDLPPTPQPKAEPLEELVLELTDLKIYEQDGIRRASGKARLVYEPANPLQPHVHSQKNWRFIAPIGPIEAEELRWYLEKYAIWPSDYFRDRANKVKENLVEWGKLLYQAAMPIEHTHGSM